MFFDKVGPMFHVSQANTDDRYIRTRVSKLIKISK